MLEAGENEGAELGETGMGRPARPVRSLASVLGTIGATDGFTQGAAWAEQSSLWLLGSVRRLV